MNKMSIFPSDIQLLLIDLSFCNATDEGEKVCFHTTRNMVSEQVFMEAHTDGGSVRATQNY